VGSLTLDLPDQAPSVPLCRRTLRFVLAELGVADERLADIELAVSEATTNVVRHAYASPGHPYRMRVELYHHCARLVIEDDGRGFAPRGHPAAVPDPNPDQSGGWGLWLIEQLADSVALTSVPGQGSRLVADFSLPQPPLLMT
jgi:serine/threonine-protein kinase RsbW